MKSFSYQKNEDMEQENLGTWVWNERLSDTWWVGVKNEEKAVKDSWIMF